MLKGRASFKRWWVLSLFFIQLSAFGEPPSFKEKAWQTAGKGLHLVRVIAVADDEEWEKIKEAVEEAEHALEPPTAVHGFWRRKLEVLKNFRQALDLRRSFENITRLAHQSRFFPDSFLREMMMTSATMFAFTHGGEFVVGMTNGVYYSAHALAGLVAGDMASAGMNGSAALFWFGMALPGLYDVACYAGQATLALWPTRWAFNGTRKFVVLTSSETAKIAGLPAIWSAIWENTTARARLMKAFATGEETATVDFEFSNEELLQVVHRTPEGGELFRLKFQPAEHGRLELVEARVMPEALVATPYSKIKEALLPYGWNVTGVIRQVRKLYARSKGNLLEYEKTFISGVETEADGGVKLTIRPHSVWVNPENRLSPAYRYLNPMNALRDCARLVAAKASSSTR